MATVAFSLGSNLGNRLVNLRNALCHLSDKLGSPTKASDVFETEPWGVTDQPFFLNACVTFETDAAPLALLEAVKLIEAEMGRKKNIRWGARLIDIDILLMDDLQLNLPDLIIPHISMVERDFVLTPLVQILPEWQHPKTGLSVSELASALISEPPLKICALSLK